MIYSYIEDKVLKTCEVTPVFDMETDILVAGLGTAGSIAAIAAAKEGASVIGIDRINFIGGASTAGCIWDYYYGSYGGLGDEISEECIEVHKKGYLETLKGSEYYSVSESVRSSVLEKNAIESGCRLLYEASPLGVFLDGNKVMGIKCFYDGRVINIRTGVIIDSTGNCFVARLAGAEVVNGRKIDGKHLAMSNTGVKMYDGKMFGAWLHASVDDCTDHETLSRTILETSTFRPFLEESFDEDSRLLYTSSVFGERSTVQLVADEVLTLEGYSGGYRTDKPLFYAFAQLDDCNFDVANSTDINQDWRLISALYFYGISLGVPLASLIPKNLDGILVACKGIGVDFDLLGCVRMRKNLEKCGEAAGIASAMAVKQKASLRELDYSNLSDRLRETGCLDEKNNVGICDLKKPIDRKVYEKVSLPASFDEIKAGLSKKEPGLTFWAVRVSKDPELINKLYEWAEDKEAVLSVNSVIALAMLGETKVRERLIDIITSGPQPLEKSPKSAFCYHPYIAALCLIGRIGCYDDIGCILSVADNSEEIADNFKHDSGSYFPVKGDWEFMIWSLTVVSVIRICQRVGTTDYDQWLKKWLDSGTCPDFSRHNLFKDVIKNRVEQYFKITIVDKI